MRTFDSVPPELLRKAEDLVSRNVDEINRSIERANQSVIWLAERDQIDAKWLSEPVSSF